MLTTDELIGTLHAYSQLLAWYAMEKWAWCMATKASTYLTEDLIIPVIDLLFQLLDVSLLDVIYHLAKLSYLVCLSISGSCHSLHHTKQRDKLYTDVPTYLRPCSNECATVIPPASDHLLCIVFLVSCITLDIPMPVLIYKCCNWETKEHCHS